MATTTTNVLSNQLAIDPNALNNVRLQANNADSTHDGLTIAARQFETYFLQMMLKSMRDTVPQDPLFGSQESKDFTSMLDQQVAQNISQNKGIGMADALIAQIERSLPQNKDTVTTHPVSYDLPAVGKAQPVVLPSAGDQSAASNFVSQFMPYASNAAQALGVPPETLVAQAALESGWGKKQLTTADGSNSYNLFNLKAGSDWTGKTVTQDVSEYKNGHVVKSTEKFRAYDSYTDAFTDYANLIANNPRYSSALNQDASGYAAGLQQGGFATDPNYSSKIMNVINSNSFRGMLQANAAPQNAG
jgi:flagellar protein FlgJ